MKLMKCVFYEKNFTSQCRYTNKLNQKEVKNETENFEDMHWAGL